MERVLAYEASAGTGKTFALVVRYLSLLFLDVRAESILALTFTNKAANEMRIRIADRLKNLKDSDELEYISKNLGLSKKEILKKQPKIYKNFLSSDIKITTIDSFFVSILRKFSICLGLTPDFSITQKDDRERIYHKFFYFLYKMKKEKSFIELSILQEKKLKDILSLFDYIQENLIDLKYQKSEYKNLEGQIFDILKKIKDEIICEKASKSAIKALDIESIDEILSSTWIQKSSLSEYKFFKKCFKDEIDRYFLDLKMALATYINKKESYFLENLDELYALFKETNRLIKKEENRLTFNDISYFTYNLLKERVDRDFLYFRLDSKIEHLLIDEFQDTSLIQYKILEPIIEEIVSGVGQKEFRTFFYVGDIKQSIYRFRGGFKELFDYVAKKFNIKKIPMQINFRSDQEIVEFTNRVFKDRYENFIIQKSSSKDKGYVEVKEGEVLTELAKNIKKVLQIGVDEDDIAILCFKNDEILEIEEYLKKEIPNIDIATESSSRLLNQEEILGIIHFFLYTYFNEEIFRLNFLSIFGLKDINIDREYFEKYAENLPLLAKKVISKFNLKILNENMLKFFDILRDYDTLGDFIFDIENIQDSIAPKEKKGIKILTIHKSKGLEFDYLFLVDRLSNAKIGYPTLIYDFDLIECKRVFLRKKGREYVDNSYKKAVEKERVLQKDDLINSLYVAFTRAKRALFVLKKSKDSVFDILDLKEESIGELKVKKSYKNKEIKDFEFCERFYGLQNIKNENEKLLTNRAIIFGNALHFALEMADFYKKGYKEAIESVKNRFGLYLDKEDILDIENRVKMLFEDSRFLEFLENSKIYKELPLSFNGEIKQLDLLFIKNIQNIVIDYKSSKENIYSHKKQVREYKEAVSKITKNPTYAYLCYLLKDRIEWVEVL